MVRALTALELAGSLAETLETSWAFQVAMWRRYSVGEKGVKIVKRKVHVVKADADIVVCIDGTHYVLTVQEEK